MKAIALIVTLLMLVPSVCIGSEVYVTREALRSSVLILSHMAIKEAKPIYKISLELSQGEQVMVYGCANVTNDNGCNVGWGIVLKETTANEYISPKQTRNVTPDMHHDSNSVVGTFEAPADGTYTFALMLWCGSSTVYGKYLTIETNNFGQVMVQIL